MRDELKLIIEAARTAGALTLKYYGSTCPVRDKGGGDPVTRADLEADACLRDMLLGAYPDCGWLSEETADTPERLQRETLWIVDPIDGTREFLGRIPEYAVSIALVEGGEPTVAVLFNPAAGELFTAVKGGGAYLDGKRVFCTETTRLDRALLIASRSETRRGEIEALRPHVQAIRPVGSIAYKLAVVASGRADLNISMQPKNEWDICAGDLLVREAGGRLFDLEGRVRQYNQKSPLIAGGLCAGNERLARGALELIAALR